MMRINRYDFARFNFDTIRREGKRAFDDVSKRWGEHSSTLEPQENGKENVDGQNEDVVKPPSSNTASATKSGSPVSKPPAQFGPPEVPSNHLTQKSAKNKRPAPAVIEDEDEEKVAETSEDIVMEEVEDPKASKRKLEETNNVFDVPATAEDAKATKKTKVAAPKKATEPKKAALKKVAEEEESTRRSRSSTPNAANKEEKAAQKKSASKTLKTFISFTSSIDPQLMDQKVLFVSLSVAIE